MGRLLERVIRRKELNISELARAIGVHRRSLYNWFNEPELKVEILERIAEVIDHDFSNEFPTTSIKKPELIKANGAMRDDEFWKDKYIDLLERYAELLKKVHD